jgi:excisionase family DNA binding protein
MGGDARSPGQLAFPTGASASGSLRAVRGAVEQATAAVPALLGSSELGASDAGLIAVLAAVVADEVASRLELQLQRRPPDPEPLRPPAAGLWLTVDEVSRVARLSHRTVYRALRSGALAGEKVGAVWRIRPAALESWATRARPPSPPESRPAVVPVTGVSDVDGRQRRGRSVHAVSYRARVRDGTA